MRTISLISFFLSLVSCNSCANITGPDAYKIHDLYRVSIAFLNDDGTTYGTPNTLGSNFPGYCLKYFDKEDLLIICYSTPSSGTRRQAKLTIEPNDKFVPTLISLIAPNEIQANVTVGETTDATTGFVRNTLDIIIDNNARDGKIKIRFLSTVDITQTGAAADNTYILSSEYFNQVDTTVTTTAFPLIPVASHCNAYKWFEITKCFIENLFKKHDLSEFELRELILAFRSEICRKNEARLAHLGVCCDEDSCSEVSCSRSSESTESECEEVCKKETVVELVTCQLTSAVLYKSASICTLFNVFFEGSDVCKDICRIMSTVLELKCSLNVEVVISLLQSIINGNCKNDYVKDCLSLKSQLDLEFCSYFSLSSIYGSSLEKRDYVSLRSLCYVEDEISSDEESNKKKTKISLKKKKNKKNKDSESSEETKKEDKEGSSGKKIAVVVGIVVVVAVCAYAVSYML